MSRAENDRHRLVIILAGYSDEIDQLLSTNPGLGSRFNTRIEFPGYAGTELADIARALVADAEQQLTPAADAALEDCCARVGEQGWADVLGNGRFIRTLCEGQVRCGTYASRGGFPTANPLLKNSSP